MTPRSLLFVYGTLRQGGRNHSLIKDQVFVRVCRTQPWYRLVDLGPYPGLLPEGECSVVGELWAISPDRWPRLDRFEGVPTLFDRREVTLDDSSVAEAYFYVGSLRQARECGDEWPV